MPQSSRKSCPSATAQSTVRTQAVPTARQPGGILPAPQSTKLCWHSGPTEGWHRHMRSSMTDTSSTFTGHSSDPESNSAALGQIQRLSQTQITLRQRLKYRFLNQQVSTEGFKVKALKVDARKSILALLRKEITDLEEQRLTRKFSLGQIMP